MWLRRFYLDTIKYGLVLPMFLMGFLALGILSRPWSEGRVRRGQFTLAVWLAAGFLWGVAYVHPRFLYVAVAFLLPWMGEGVGCGRK